MKISKHLLLFTFMALFSNEALYSNDQIENDRNELNAIDRESGFETKNDHQKVFVPVKIEQVKTTEKEKKEGKLRRLRVSYGSILYRDLETSYRYYNSDGDEVRNVNMDRFNEYMSQQMQLDESHLVAIEYYVTRNLSVELADSYRAESLQGEYSDSIPGGSHSGFPGLGGDRSSPQTIEIDSHNRIHDIQLGLNYTVRMIDEEWGGFNLTFKGSAGLIHLDTKTKYDYQFNEDVAHEYTGLAGYSYGVGVAADLHIKNFFIRGGVDYRTYKIAPYQYDDGSKQEFEQKGYLVYLKVGFQF